MDARAACVTNNVKKRSLSLMQQQAANQSRERTCISFGPGSPRMNKQEECQKKQEKVRGNKTRTRRAPHPDLLRAVCTAEQPRR